MENRKDLIVQEYDDPTLCDRPFELNKKDHVQAFYISSLFGTIEISTDTND